MSGQGGIVNLEERLPKLVGRFLLVLAIMAVALALVAVWPSATSCSPKPLPAQAVPTDKDLDGLPDQMELDGCVRTKGGQVDMLSRADPKHRDLFVDVYHRPGATLLNASTWETLAAYYDQAPIMNPDGTTGVHLHVRQMREIRGDLLVFMHNLRRNSTEASTIQVFFDNVPCFGIPCGSGGWAWSDILQIAIAAQDTGKFSHAGLQVALRYAFQHEMEHIMWDPVPPQYWASPTNRPHTNIPGDPMCESSCQGFGFADGAWPWQFANAFWMDKQTHHLIHEPEWFKGAFNAPS